MSTLSTVKNFFFLDMTSGIPISVKVADFLKGYYQS
jgi:hypothetical protein